MWIALVKVHFSSLRPFTYINASDTYAYKLTCEYMSLTLTHVLWWLHLNGMTLWDIDMRKAWRAHAEGWFAKEDIRRHPKVSYSMGRKSRKMSQRPSPTPKMCLSCLNQLLSGNKAGRYAQPTLIFLLSLKLEKMGSTFVEAQVCVTDTSLI